MRPLHPCGVSSCPHLTDKPRCPEHTITREERNPKPVEQAKHYGSARWKAIRAIVRRNHPICQHCHRVPSTSVHHVNNDWQDNRLENLEAWCDPCHRKHSGSEHRKKQKS